MTWVSHNIDATIFSANSNRYLDPRNLGILGDLLPSPCSLVEFSPPLLVSLFLVSPVCCRLAASQLLLLLLPLSLDELEYALVGMDDMSTGTVLKDLKCASYLNCVYIKEPLIFN